LYIGTEGVCRRDSTQLLPPWSATPAVQRRGAWRHAAAQQRGDTAGMRSAGEQALARPAEGAVNGRERALLGPGALEQGVCGTPTMAPSCCVLGQYKWASWRSSTPTTASSGLIGNALGANALILQHCRNLFDVMPPSTGQEGYKEPSANIHTKLNVKPTSTVA
jgi:hypothetical protein